jgi:hypothetical protein
MARSEDRAVVEAVGRRYWRAAEAAVVVEAWRRSGESLSAFTARHGIHPRRLSRWVAELDGRQGREEAMVFHPVRLEVGGEGRRRSSKRIEIVTTDGYRVRVPAGFATGDLEGVLRALAVVGAGC